MWTNRSILRILKWAREANDWDSESHCADVNSLAISNRQVIVTGRLQSSQCGRQSTHWKINFAFDIIQNFCWLMNAMFRPKLKQGRQGANVGNQASEWRPSAVFLDRIRRWAPMKSRNIVVFTNTFCFEAWNDKYWTVDTQCWTSSTQNTVTGCFKMNPQRPYWMALP